MLSLLVRIRHQAIHLVVLILSIFSAPATARLLTGVPVFAAGPPMEMTTPTGAALAVTLASGFGPLPPMKIHCAQLVEGALRSPPTSEGTEPQAEPPKAAPQAPSLFDQLNAGTEGKVKIILDK